MFTLGGQELLIIVVIALLLFGPDKIPQLARTIGRFTREFNKYKDIMESTIRMEIANADAPKPDELTVQERIAKAGAASQALLEGSGTAEPPDEPDEDGIAVAESAPRPHAVPSADESDEEDEE